MGLNVWKGAQMKVNGLINPSYEFSKLNFGTKPKYLKKKFLFIRMYNGAKVPN